MLRCESSHFFINVFRRLRTQSVRNKKPPALRVGNKRLYQRTHLSVTIKLFKLIVKKRKVSKMANKTNSLSSTTWMVQVSYSCKIKHFQKTVIRWKYAFIFCNLPKLSVKSLYRICCVNQGSDRLRILEICR